MKEWKTERTYSIYKIQLLNYAEAGDDMNYRIVPALPGDDGEASTGFLYPEHAIDAINERGVLII